MGIEELVTQHEGTLLRYAARILNSPSAAEDVVQNAFIKLFRARHVMRHPPAKIKAWLYRVTHNEAVDYIRRESRLKRLHTRQAEEDMEDCAGRGANGHGVEEERRGSVLRHLRSLHPREQQVVLLRLEEGLSYNEISVVTGRSEGNVGNILHHAVRKLATRLKREGVV